MDMTERTVFLDKLSIASFWYIFRQKIHERIIVLDSISPRYKFLVWLLLRKGVEVNQADFFAGHLRMKNDENVRRAYRRLSGEIAFKAAEITLTNSSKLSYLNEYYGRNTILLFISKQLYVNVEYYSSRMLVAQALSNNSQDVVLLEKPFLFDRLILKDYLDDINIDFYKSMSVGLLATSKAVASNMVFAFRLLINRFNTFSDIQVSIDTNSVLMIQEDSIGSDRSIRNQPHWHNRNRDPKFTTCIIKSSNLFKDVNSSDVLELKNSKIEIFSDKILYKAFWKHHKNKAIRDVNKRQYEILGAILTAKGMSNKYFLLCVMNLLRQAKLMGAVSLLLKTKIFVTGEPQSQKVDSMQLIAKFLNIKTITYQYSFLGFSSPLMMSTADEFIVFSDFFKKVFSNKFIVPRSFKSHGYVYDYAQSLVVDKSLLRRQYFEKIGVKFVICYFDENVQKDSWGIISEEFHLFEIHELVKFALSDSSIGLLIKSQFMFNTPSKLYPDDSLINSLKGSGRYLELSGGKHRNDIFPTEAALASDICINHKFGGTASLESAVAGKRSILLDPFNSYGLYDDLFIGTDIIYKNVSVLLESIKLYRKGVDHPSLGDWSDILHNFDPYCDGKASERFTETLQKYMVS